MSAPGCAAACARRLPGTRDLLALAAAHPRRYPALLESAACGPAARWDILFAFPEGSLALAHDGAVRDHAGREHGKRFLGALDVAWRRHRGEPAAADLPFAGGWLLYLGYELAMEIEPGLRIVAPARGPVPVALALRCPAAILVDRQQACTWLVAEPERGALLDELARDLAASAPRAWPSPRIAGPLRVEEDEPQGFIDAVAQVHAYLRAGDTFQVNVSRGWRAATAAPLEPAAVYAALREVNPAPFAGLLQQPGWAIASSSPERLLEVRGGMAQTRPIAGTRARAGGDGDAALVAELLGHAKERAEHVMLVDLERNDLGRVCVPGTIEVDEMMAVESYAHVHHIVSNVRGRLRTGVTPGEAIAAMFPGGTITGCPKLRCMEIIAELEGVPRGAYTGSLGYLSHTGELDLNILIRTMLLRDGGLEWRAGAGIVVDSDAAHELAETRAKARGLVRALGVMAA